MILYTEGTLLLYDIHISFQTNEEIQDFVCQPDKEIGDSIMFLYQTSIDLIR